MSQSPRTEHQFTQGVEIRALGIPDFGENPPDGISLDVEATEEVLRAEESMKGLLSDPRFVEMLRKERS